MVATGPIDYKVNRVGKTRHARDPEVVRPFRNHPSLDMDSTRTGSNCHQHVAWIVADD